MTATAKRVLVALSGGVDSSVCVHLLKQQGYDVCAAVLNMSDCHGDTVLAARQAADSLGVTLHVKDMSEIFEREVVQYFIRSYQTGFTPNPCIICNPKVKFKAMLELADELGCDYIATGHYARVEHQGGKAVLLRGESVRRDQSYMLYRLGQDVLTRLLLPLSHLEKSEVRAIAASLGLDCASKPDSQENCFIPDNDYAKYIEGRVGMSPIGDFIDPDGNPCGKHKGIVHYTVGQRKGLGVALGRPVFIKAVDAKDNRIYLADKGGDSMDNAVISDMNIVSGEPFCAPFHAEVKIRSTATPVGAMVSPLTASSANVVFDTPQRAVARGQSLVIYDGEAVLGGGFIHDTQ